MAIEKDRKPVANENAQTVYMDTEYDGGWSMRIVFLCNEYPPYASPGGIGVFTHTIAHGLVGNGHKVTVVGYGKNSGEWDDKGVRVVVLPESTTKIVAWFVNRRRLYSWLKREACDDRIDIVETPEYQGMLPFRFPWCPVVIRLHSSGRPAARSTGILEKRTLKLHPNWIAVSDWIRRDTEEKYDLRPTHAKVVYNPVKSRGGNMEVPTNLPHSYVLYAGTVSDRKGAYVLAEAAQTFLAEFPDLHLVYIGGLTEENGQRADKTIRQILGERFAARVHFPGFMEHGALLACMKKAKVFAFPSKLEAFGLVPVEAMSCGTPVVYTTAGPGPEVIDDGVTGLLADPYRPNDVADKVLRLLKDTAFAAQLAENGKKAVKERFSLQRCVDETVAFYRVILSDQIEGHSRLKR